MCVAALLKNRSPEKMLKKDTQALKLERLTGNMIFYFGRGIKPDR